MAKYKSYLREVKGEMKRRREKALQSVGHFGLSEITVRAPVLTGALRDSYDFHTETDTLTLGSPIDYAPWVELGTSKSRAQPHFVPAITGNLDRVNRLLQEAYNNG